MRGFSGFKKETRFEGPRNTTKKKKYPKHYTEEDIKFLEKQNEDVVREEDKTIYPKGKSRRLQNLK